MLRLSHTAAMTATAVSVQQASSVHRSYCYEQKLESYMQDDVDAARDACRTTVLQQKLSRMPVAGFSGRTLLSG